MDENDDIYVMADSMTPKGSPIKSKKMSLRMIGLLIAILTVIGGVLAYLVIAKTSSTQQVGFAKQGTQADNQSVLNPLKRATSTASTDNTQTSAVLAKPHQERLIINFAFNSLEVLPSEMSRIESLWSRVRGRKGIVTIEGHADELGAEEYNQELSKKRAEKVAEFLQKLGMDNKYKVTTQGLGETKPVANNSTEKGRALNRRVVIDFVRKN